jgi:hypothetical protein
MELSLRKQVEIAPGMHVLVDIKVDDEGELAFSDGAGVQLSRRLVDQAKRQHGLAIMGLVRAASKKLNREVEALGQFHLESPSPHARAAYRPVPFLLKQPSTPALLQRWHAQREAHDAAGDARRTFLERDILESESAMEAHLQAALAKVQWPREVNVSFEVSARGSSVTIHIVLPEIADFPARTATVPARGCRVSIREMAPARKQALYQAHVHGIGFRIIAETFAALPAAGQVTLFAHTRRADDRLYAVAVSREDWGKIDFAQLDEANVAESLARFDLQATSFFKGSPRRSRSTFSSSRSMTFSS